MSRRRNVVPALPVVVAAAIGAFGAAPAGAATFTVTNTNNSGAGSLRQAITDANVTLAADTVNFNIPGAGLHTITLTSPLPAISRPLTVNGASEPDFAGIPVVQLNGTGAGATANGLRVTPTANASVIRALTINRFGRNGIVLESDGNEVRGCFVGTNAAGTTELPNGRDGVSVLAGSATNTIGGTTTADRNVLSGNGRAGVFITGAGTTGNLVRGNYIGTNKAGTAAVGNQVAGVWLSAGASTNTIGGAATTTRNLISGNDHSGVLIAGAATQGNTVRANTIGMDKGRTSAVPNGGSGVLIGGAAKNNTVGGTTAGERNWISGNAFDGVEINGPNTDGNVVQGNRIGLNGAVNAAVGNDRYGVSIRDSAGDNTVQSNVISGHNTPSDSAGVLISGQGTSGNDVRANRIGTNGPGTAAVGNSIGVLIRGGATANDVFGGNQISGNAIRGIDIGGPGTTGNLVRGNLIGLNAAGTAALANPNGIFLHNAASNNRIGGTTAGDRNVISGNTSRGIEVSINAPTANLIQGNYIGLNAAGTAAVGNNTGIILLAGATNTTIGGTAAGAGNVISGNATNGIYLGDSTTLGTVVRGNRIGTNAAGTAAVGNGATGVQVTQNIQDAQVGGTTGTARNVISGNVNGVIVAGNATNVRVQGNFIGTDITGTAPLGNGVHGIAVAGDAHQNVIGGQAAGAGNRIANNGSGDGVLIGSDPAQGAAGLTDPAGVGNSVLGNRIFSNAGLGIDLGPEDEVTLNDMTDVDTGPNGLQNFPVIDQAVSGGSTFVSGSLNSRPNREYRLEFFTDSVGDPTGYGEGRTFLGARTVSIPNATNDVTFEYVFGASTSPGTGVSATATDLLSGDTSEFGLEEIAE